MTFLPVTERSTPCLGNIRASSITSWLITALATEKLSYTRESSCSTSSRSLLFSRASSRKPFISWSRLSFISLWPRLAVTRRRLRVVSIILVGFTFNLSIISPYLPRYFSMYSSLILLSSLLGSISSSFQPIFRVSSMVLSVS